MGFHVSDANFLWGCIQNRLLEHVKEEIKAKIKTLLKTTKCNHKRHKLVWQFAELTSMIYVSGK